MQAEITIGADPEFVLAQKQGSQLIPSSAIGKIGGSKEKPLEVPYGAVQEDNVLAEINIHPATSQEEFIHHLGAVKGALSDMLVKHNLEVTTFGSVDYPEEELIKHPDSFRIGCDPDFNAYTGEENPAPMLVSTLRTPGGHVHIGFDSPTPVNIRKMVIVCDLLMGVPSVLIDGDHRRRELYGQAGSYRPKAYGLEYRTLGNFWVHSLDYMRWVYTTSVRAANEYEAWYRELEAKDLLGDIPYIINSGDKDKAEHIINYFNLEVPK